MKIFTVGDWSLHNKCKARKFSTTQCFDVLKRRQGTSPRTNTTGWSLHNKCAACKFSMTQCFDITKRGKETSPRPYTFAACSTSPPSLSIVYWRTWLFTWSFLHCRGQSIVTGRFSLRFLPTFEVNTIVTTDWSSLSIDNVIAPYFWGTYRRRVTLPLRKREIELTLKRTTCCDHTLRKGCHNICGITKDITMTGTRKNCSLFLARWTFHNYLTFIYFLRFRPRNTFLGGMAQETLASNKRGHVTHLRLPSYKHCGQEKRWNSPWNATVHYSIRAAWWKRWWTTNHLPNLRRCQCQSQYN